MRAALILVAAGCAGAPREPATVLDARIEVLRPMLGRWRAEARNPATGDRFVLDYDVAPAMDGAWLVGDGYVASMKLRVHDLWGVDDGGVVRVIFDSSGTWGTVRGRGWENGVLRLEGEVQAGGQKVRVRETITQVGDELRAVWEQEKDGQWSAYSEEALRRR